MADPRNCTRRGLTHGLSRRTATMTEINAVFEGGGVKGIALVGALARTTEEQINITGYAGSSAGAIVAAFASVGYHAAELKAILETTDYMSFLDRTDSISLADLRSFIEDIGRMSVGENIALVREELGRIWGAQERWPGTWHMWRAWKSLKKRRHDSINVIKDRLPLFGKLFATLFNDYGLYGTGTFLEWLQSHLNKKGNTDPLSHQVTFGSLFEQTKCQLKILTADVGARAPFLYSYQNSADLEVAQAVQASMSIPFFFKPFPFGTKFFIDGGTISNFPAWTFDKNDRNPATESQFPPPILGFRLVPETFPSQSIASFRQFGYGVIQTVLSGSDMLQTRRIPDLHLIQIPIPSRFSTTAFDLSPDDSEELHFRGRQAADRFFVDPANRTALRLPNYNWGRRP